MSVLFSNVSCPKCKSPVWKFGKDPYTGLQKYRCKNLFCRYQFVPGKPQRKKTEPEVFCPRCGSRMHIFKRISDGLRFRCNNHSKKDRRHCSHKINIPLPGKAFTIASNPLDALNVSLPRSFSWNKMKFSKPTVSLALYFAVFKALPAGDIVDIMAALYNVTISHDTITRWNHKASLNLHHNLGPLHVPYSQHKRLFVEDSQFSVRGKKRWVWLGKDSKFDSLQTWFLSPRRSTEYARSAFNIAFAISPTLKKANVVTDGLHSYPSALDDLGYETEKRHIRYVGWDWDPVKKVNNNRLERQWSTFKVNAVRFRGFKSDLGLWAFITNQVYFHNYFKANKRLDGITPAQAANTQMPYCHSPWKLFTKAL